MNLEDFKNKLERSPKTIAFSQTMEIIDAYYDFTPAAFTNGALANDEGKNSGSCKLFAFAKDQNLTKESTLACFGDYYFKDVLEDPNGTGHQNIRNFIKTGFNGLEFKVFPLVKK
jgi:hypothetical protein